MFALVVEDEPQIARLVARRLRRSGFEADTAGSLDAAQRALADRVYRVVVLDRRLPDGDGITLLPCVRESTPKTCVLILSAMDDVPERIAGLEAGAADYMTKPFDGNELVARIRAQLRQLNAGAPAIQCGALALHPDSGLVYLRGAPIELHRREAALLAALMRNFARVTPRALLIREIFGARDVASHDNALEALVSRLRKRLFELEAGVSITTARGMGYLLSADSVKQ
jgi:two-component system OmpR family response regulator